MENNNTVAEEAITKTLQEVVEKTKKKMSSRGIVGYLRLWC